MLRVVRSSNNIYAPPSEHTEHRVHLSASYSKAIKRLDTLLRPKNHRHMRFLLSQLVRHDTRSQKRKVYSSCPRIASLQRFSRLPMRIGARWIRRMKIF